MAWALVAAVTLQAALLPRNALKPWLPQTQRESEGESNTPEESSRETVPSAVVNSESGRARRAEADRLARLERLPIVSSQGSGVVRKCHALVRAEQAARNGVGCPLRC